MTQEQRTAKSSSGPLPVLRRDCGGSCGGSCGSCSKKKPLQRKHAPQGESRFGRDFSHVAARSIDVRVGPANDAFEREADHVADAVVSGAGAQPEQSAAPAVQRQIGDEAPAAAAETAETVPEEEEAIAEEEGDEDEEGEDVAGEEDESGDSYDEPTGQPKLEAGASEAGGTARVPIGAGGGQPLPRDVRSTMEERIGHDFSSVRVHADADGARAADSVHARAFTVGSDIYFNSGRYEPSSPSGQRLLAHELTHVVQQSGGAAAGIQRKDEPKKPKKAGTKGPAKLKTPPKKPKARFCQDKHGKNCRTPCQENAPECGDDTACAPGKGKVTRHPCCGNEKCPKSGPKDSNFFIRHLDVDLGSQMVTAEWGDATKTIAVNTFLSSPNAGATPLGKHKVGVKCGPCHTNCHGEGMGWFTGFPGFQFGFHNSQTVAKGVKSHGCVRVLCDCAKELNKNTSSDVTTVCVHKGGKGSRHCEHALPEFGDADPKHKSSCGTMHLALPPKPLPSPAKKAAKAKPKPKGKGKGTNPPPAKPAKPKKVTMLDEQLTEEEEEEVV